MTHATDCNAGARKPETPAARSFRLLLQAGEGWGEKEACWKEALTCRDGKR